MFNQANRPTSIDLNNFFGLPSMLMPQIMHSSFFLVIQQQQQKRYHCCKNKCKSYFNGVRIECNILATKIYHKYNFYNLPLVLFLSRSLLLLISNMMEDVCTRFHWLLAGNVWKKKTNTFHWSGLIFKLVLWIPQSSLNTKSRFCQIQRFLNLFLLPVDLSFWSEMGTN